MKVAVVTGICVERDAISAAAANQAEVIAELDGVDDVTLVAHAFDRTTAVRQVSVGNSWDLLALPAIEQSDLVVFHWGIRYDLFNALPAVNAERATVVHFHNLTPSHLVAENDRPVIEESERQIQLPMMTGSTIWTESRYNIETLLELGFDGRSIRFMPFPIDPLGPVGRRRRWSGTVRLLTVGRLVPAKGVDVLVEAVARAVERLDVRVSVVIAGSAQLSEREFIESLRASIRAYGLGRMVRIRLDLDDDELWKEYRRADVLVVPSLHEGLCVPVVEAYLAGCRVIGTDAGNLPYVVQPPDPVVPAGEVGPLADAIVTMGRAVAAGDSAPPDASRALIDDYSRQGVSERLREAIAEEAGRPAR